MTKTAYLLITLLVVFASATWGAAEPTAVDKIEQSYRQGKIYYQTTLHYKLLAIVDIKNLPSQFQSTTPVKCGTSVLLEASRNRSRLGEKALTLLARPTLSGPEHIKNTTHFRIHWTDQGSDSTNSAFVDTLAISAEHCWDKEVTTMEWDAPPADYDSGGDGNYDIYVKQLTGVYGYVQRESPGPDPDQEEWTSFMVVGKWITNMGDLKVTVAHEFNHSCQFSYSGSEGVWWMENCATWMEEEVYDNVNNYYQYLGTLPSVNPLTYPERPITYFGDNYQYGGCLWPMTLSKEFGDSLIREMWELMGLHTGSYTIGDIDSTLRTQYGSNFYTAATVYAASRFFTGANTDTSVFEEGSNWTNPYVDPLHQHSAYPASGNQGDYPPWYLGTNFITFENIGGAGGVHITFDGDDGKDWAAVAVRFKLGSGSRLDFMSLDANAYGEIDIGWEGYDRIVLVPVVLELDTTFKDLPYTYSAAYDSTIGIQEELEAPSADRILKPYIEIYPNPSIGSVKIQYNLPISGSLNISIYDISGRVVRTLIDGRKSTGDHAMTWNHASLPSGVYFCRLITGGSNEVKRVVLLAPQGH